MPGARARHRAANECFRPRLRRRLFWLPAFLWLIAAGACAIALARLAPAMGAPSATSTWGFSTTVWEAPDGRLLTHAVSGAPRYGVGALVNLSAGDPHPRLPFLLDTNQRAVVTFMVTDPSGSVLSGSELDRFRSLGA